MNFYTYSSSTPTRTWRDFFFKKIKAKPTVQEQQPKRGCVEARTVASQHWIRRKLECRWSGKFLKGKSSVGNTYQDVWITGLVRLEETRLLWKSRAFLCNKSSRISRSGWYRLLHKVTEPKEPPLPTPYAGLAYLTIRTDLAKLLSDCLD